MPGLEDLLSGGGGAPQAQPGQPEAPAGPGGGQSPAGLMAMLQGGQQQQQPKPTMDHVMAATHYLQSINHALEPLLQDEKLGKVNMRPKIFDAAASLIGDRVLTLPMVMKAIKTLPDDPVQQKAWLIKMVKTNQMAQDKVMDDYHASGSDYMQDAMNTKWTPDSHGDHLKDLMSRYAR